MRKLSFFLLLTCLSYAVVAQPYSIVIKGGHVIDPKNNINGIMDVAITTVRSFRSRKPSMPRAQRRLSMRKGYTSPLV